MVRHHTPIDPNCNLTKARAHLLCIESILLNVKSINNKTSTQEVELKVSIDAIQSFINKANELLKENNV